MNCYLKRWVIKMETSLTKIEYTKKNKINLTDDNASPEAREVISSANDSDSLVLRVRINSPVFIEAAAPLTSKGIKSICSNN